MSGPSAGARGRPLGIVGNLNVDLVVSTVERFPVWDEELVVEGARVEFAGSAGYAALAAGALGLDVFVVSTVGDDVFGHALAEQADWLGFDTSGVEVLPGSETSLGMVFVGEGGRRGILSTLGAHAEMDVAVAERHDARVAQCAEVFLCGNYLLPRFSPEETAPYARRLRGRGQTVVFDPSWDPSGWGERTREGTYALLSYTDIYMPNQEELTRLTGERDWHVALNEGASRCAGEVVLKRGADGAVWASGDERIEIPGFLVSAVSTIGAGDVFDAAYLYARRQEWQPESRLRFASAYAALVISHFGPRSYPDAAGVHAFLGARGLSVA